jgi:Fanconi anemia group M protein
MRPTVAVDVHEMRSVVPENLEALGIAVVKRSLRVGDYDVGARTVVERKTTADLAMSLRSGRLWRQLGFLRRSCTFPVLLVEGRPPRVLLGDEPARGLMLAILDQGIAVLTSADPAETAAWISSLARRRQVWRPRGRPSPH